MARDTIRKYFKFVNRNRPVYFHFNKQLMISELAGFGAGVGLAEAAAAVTRDEFTISVSSGIADYTGSLLGFLGIFYSDNKMQYRELGRKAPPKRFPVRVMTTAQPPEPSFLAIQRSFVPCSS